MTKPRPPVPPRELRAQWINDCPILSPGATGGPMLRIGTDWKIVNNKAAAWGWEQAIPEREELAGLLQELTPQVTELANLLAGDGFTNDAQSVYELADRARAAAERLRGGDADG